MAAPIFQMAQVPNPKMALTSENNIVLYSADHEMLRVAEDGFYIRGVRVPADEKEASEVYNCFKEWLTWAQMTR